jgi:hypothetical protein
MKYKITIDAVDGTEQYSRNTLYEQTTDTIDLPAIVAIVNHIPYTAPAAQAGMRKDPNEIMRVNNAAMEAAKEN